MADKIAVLENPQGYTASAYENGQVVVYRQNRGLDWRPIRERPYTCVQNLRELRTQMAGVIDFLDTCRILAAQAISGIPLVELGKAGISVWEVDGKPTSFLNGILAAEKREKPAEPVVQLVPRPVEVSPGHFRISLQEIQKNNSGLSSKQVLLPILGGDYQSLDIVFDHVPPWLENKILQGELTATIRQEQPNQAIITIVANGR